MAVSPLAKLNSVVVTNVDFTRDKALPVRTNSIGMVHDVPRLKVEKGKELAEQLNEDTKNKYVKGEIRFIFLCFHCSLTENR